MGGARVQLLIYASKNKIEVDVDVSCEQIIAGATIRNAQLNLTGALIFTGTHFAQVLEGDPKNIDILMASVKRDPRHQMLSVVYQSPAAERLFPDWKMAYQGPSRFVSRHVTHLIDAKFGSNQKQATEWLVKLAREFSV